MKKRQNYLRNMIKDINKNLFSIDIVTSLNEFLGDIFRK